MINSIRSLYVKPTLWCVIRTQFTGFHYYRDAPETVSFLRNLHRHVFKVEVRLEQNHTERDLEYFITKAVIDELIKSILLDHMDSCERMAEKLCEGLKDRFFGRSLRVMIDEDGENGGLYSVDYRGEF